MKRVLVLAAALCLLVGCAAGGGSPIAISETPGSSGAATQSGDSATEYRKITPQEAQKLMTEDATVLDVRTPEEYAEGHIPGAVLLPDGEIRDKAAQVLPDKNQTILVYCRSGRRSAAAAKELAEMGYTAVYDFGGIQDWPGEVVKE